MAGVYKADGDIICTTKRIYLKNFADIVCGGDTLKVPLFQRRYGWPSKVVDKLFADIATGATLQTLKQDNAGIIDQGHSVGLILLSNRKVLDGQQRLTTVCLFLAALRDFVTTVATEAQGGGIQRDPGSVRLCGQINRLLFPKARHVEAVKEVREGMEVEGGALLPTYFDRKCYYMWTLPGVEAKLNADGKDCVSAVYSEFLSLLQAESWQVEMLTKLGVVKELPKEGAFKLSSKQAGLLAEAMFASATRKLTFKVFEVEQTDVQTVFERLAFREGSMLGLLNNAHPGIIAREEDLIRNLLLSYFPTEAEQTAVYFKYWVPIERTHNGVKLQELFEAYIKQLEVEIDPLHVKRLFNAPLSVPSNPSMNSIGPTKYNTTFGAKLHQGGAKHLDMRTLFPAYTKFRSMLDQALVSEGINLSEAPQSVEAEKIVQALLQRLVTFATERATTKDTMET